MRSPMVTAIAGLLVSLALVAVVAAFGGRYAPSSWYQEIPKPAWTPPDWLFGPVWTVLYVMMAVSAWLVWRKAGGLQHAWVGLSLYLLQLILNAMWSWIFFGRHQIGLALVDLGLLWCTVLATCILFWPVLPAAGMLLVPYLAWVSFAGALNYAIWRLNG